MISVDTFGSVGKGLMCVMMVAGLACMAGGVYAQQAPPVATPPPLPPPPPSAGADKDIVEVEVEGEGLSKDEALRAALRAALERGGRTEIFSDTKVENYQVMHDTIIARALGLVKDYKVLEEKKGEVGDTWKVRIRAQVSKKVLASNWGELQNVLNQIGRPKVLVWINERIDGELQEESLLENKIEERLLKSGFDIVARKAVEVVRQKELADADATGNIAKMQAIAKDHDAHIFLAGTSNANHAEITNAYNVSLVMYNCDAEVKMFYTDTGKLLASKGLPNARGGARGRTAYSPQAGRQALENVSGPLVDSIYQQVMEQWATALGAGGEIVLEVQGLKFAPANRLRKALEGMDKIKHVNMDFTKDLSKFRINGELSAQDLAERLSEGELAKVLEVSDLKLNRIQAKALEGKPQE